MTEIKDEEMLKIECSQMALLIELKNKRRLRHNEDYMLKFLIKKYPEEYQKILMGVCPYE
jgi:hypothetical protein